MYANSASVSSIAHGLRRAVIPTTDAKKKAKYPSAIDETAFSEILPEVLDYVRTAVRRSLRPVGLGYREDEVVQEVLLKVVTEMRRRGELTDAAVFGNRYKSWVMSTLTNHYRHIRGGIGREYVGLDWVPETSSDPRERMELAIDFRRGLERLHFLDQHVIRTFLSTDGHYADTGRLLGYRRQNMWLIVARAMRRLRNEEPVSNDSGRCLGRSIEIVGADGMATIAIVLPMGAEKWVQTGHEVEIRRQRGTIQVLERPAPAPPAITISGVNLERLLKPDRDVLVAGGPPFRVSVFRGVR